MEKGNLGPSSFSYKDYKEHNRKFNEQDYILVVKMKISQIKMLFLSYIEMNK